jgi:predicted ribosomally synthesized peptide with nif11-like leader
MSTSAADAFIAKLDSDPEFADRLYSLREDPAAVHGFVAEAGFDATPDEIREAMLEKYGSKLSEEQLAAVAGGMATVGIVATTVSAVGLGVAAAGAAAAAA